ncbi:MAG: hypothetical protein ACRD4S_09545 [Candidatus Acidiferrales bacterium]
MKKFLRTLVIGCAALVITAPGIRAQDQSQQNQNQQNQGQQNQNNGQQGTQPVQPVQPIPNPDSNAPQNNSEDANTIPAVVGPDETNVPLTGALTPSFGVAPEHSYIVPSFDFLSSVNSNGAYSAGNNNQVVTEQYLLGGITLEKVGTRNELSVNYLGGRSFSPNGDIYNSTTQLFGLQDKWMTSRWNGVLADQMTYASEPLFNGLGAPGSGLGLPGLNIQPGFQAMSTVFVNRSPILDNSAVAEANYQASPRGSFTFVGSSTLLHYYGAGLIDSNSRAFEAGYNYQLSAKDTVGVSYLFDVLHFGGNLQSINEQVVEASYGRHIARRLSLQLGAGPDIATIHQPGFASNTLASWRANALLAYQLERTTLSLSYTHYLSNGTGVFLGSKSDLVTGSLARQLSRNWSASVSAGYARNSALVPASIVVPGFSGNIDSLSGSGGIARAIGRNMRIFANYTMYYQTSRQSLCLAPGCATNLVNQQGTLGFSWHATPILLH